MIVLFMTCDRYSFSLSVDEEKGKKRRADEGDESSRSDRKDKRRKDRKSHSHKGAGAFYYGTSVTICMPPFTSFTC